MQNEKKMIDSEEWSWQIPGLVSHQNREKVTDFNQFAYTFLERNFHFF